MIPKRRQKSRPGNVTGAMFPYPDNQGIILTFFHFYFHTNGGEDGGGEEDGLDVVPGDGVVQGADVNTCYCCLRHDRLIFTEKLFNILWR